LTPLLGASTIEYAAPDSALLEHVVLAQPATEIFAMPVTDYDPRRRDEIRRDEENREKPVVWPWIAVAVTLGLVLVVGGGIFASSMQDMVKDLEKNELKRQEEERKRKQQEFALQMPKRPEPVLREFPQEQPPLRRPAIKEPEEKTIPESEWLFKFRPRPTKAERGMFDHIERSVADKKQEKSDRVGHDGLDLNDKGTEFVDISAQPALLVGFEFTYGRHDDARIINAIRPIYWTREKTVGGEWRGKPTGKQSRVESNPGFVVAGVTAYGGERLTGLKVSFRRIQNAGLDADSRYESLKFGATSDGRVVNLVGDGSPVIGIWGVTGETHPKPGVSQLRNFGLVSVPANFETAATKPIP